MLIASKIPNVYRIGINFGTLIYFGLRFEDVEEEYDAPTFDINFSEFATVEELEYLEKRIEIDSVMAAVNDNERFWKYILDNLKAKFPTRNYNRGIDIPEFVVPTVIEKLNDMVKFLGIRLTQDKRNEMAEEYDNYDGLIDDVGSGDKMTSNSGLRIKIEFARFIIRHNLLLIDFTDKKASILLGINGLILVLLFGIEKTKLTNIDLLFFLATGISFALSCFFSILTILPRLSKVKENTKIYFKSITSAKEKDYLNSWIDINEVDILNDYLRNIYLLAHIQSRKIKLLHTAAVMDAIGVGLIVVLLFLGYLHILYSYF